MALSDEQKYIAVAVVGIAAVAGAYFAYKSTAGGKPAQYPPKKKAAKATDKKKEKANPDPKDSQIWTVTVHKGAEGRYGMVWKNTRQQGRCLKITDLKPQGAISKLNKSLPVKTQIKPGDFIRAVNSKRAYEEMRNELGAETLTLELERIPK